MSTTKTELLKIIRQKYLDCVCFQAKEVEQCPSEHCALWPFRFAKDPYKTPQSMSEAQRANLAKDAECAKSLPSHRSGKLMALSNIIGNHLSGVAVIPALPWPVKNDSPE